MIAGPDLARWLGDPEAQRASLARSHATAARLGRTRMLRILRDALAACDGSRDAVLAIASDAVMQVAEIEALVSQMITEARADPFFHPLLRPLATEINQGLLLFDDPLLQLSFGVISVDALAAKKLEGAAAPASISFTGVTTLVHFVRAGGALLSLWEAPPIRAGFVGADSGMAALTARRHMRDGDVLTMDGRRESFVIEHADGPIVHVQAVVKAGAAPLSAEYDSRTCRFIAAASTDEAASRTQMMVTLLRLLGRTDAAPVFEQALRSPLFYARWHVMREYLGLDAEAALPALRAMAGQDPHPDVRTAARQTLQAVFEEEPCLA